MNRQQTGTPGTEQSSAKYKIVLHIEFNPTDPSNTLNTKILELSQKKAKQTTFNDILQQLQDELQIIFPQNSQFVMTTTCITPDMIVMTDQDDQPTGSHSSVTTTTISDEKSMSKHDKMMSFGNLVNMMSGSKKRKSVPASLYYSDTSEHLILSEPSTAPASEIPELGDAEMKREFVKMKSTVLSMKEYAHTDHVCSSDSTPPIHDKLYLEVFPNCSPTRSKVFGNYLQTICKNETLFNFHFLMKNLGKSTSMNSNWIMSNIQNQKKKSQLGSQLSPLTVRSSQLNNVALWSEEINKEKVISALTEEERLHIREPALFLLRDIRTPFLLRSCFNFLMNPSEFGTGPRLCAEGIFRQAGSKLRTEAYVKKFNTILAFPHLFPNGVDFPSGTDPNMVTDLIKRFLREMQDCLLTYEKYDEFIQLYKPHANLEDVSEQADPNVYSQLLEGTKRLVQGLPQVNQAVLRELLKILQVSSVGEYAVVTKMTPKTMAIVMGPNLLFVPQSSVAVVVDDLKRMSIRTNLLRQQQTLPIICQICRFLIENVDKLFSSSNYNYRGSIAGDDTAFNRKSTQLSASMLQQLNAALLEKENEADIAISEAEQKHQESIKALEQQFQELQLEYQSQLLIFANEIEDLRKIISDKEESIVELKKEGFSNLQKEATIQQLQETLELLQKEKNELESQAKSLSNQIEELKEDKVAKDDQIKQLTEFCERLQTNLETKDAEYKKLKNEVDDKVKNLERQSVEASKKHQTDLKTRLEEEEKIRENRLAQLMQVEKTKWKQEVNELISKEQEKLKLESAKEKQNLVDEFTKQQIAKVEEVQTTLNNQMQNLKQDYERKLQELQSKLELVKHEKEEDEKKIQTELQIKLENEQKRAKEEAESLLAKQKEELEKEEILPLKETVNKLEQEVEVKTKQFYHQALLNMKLILQDTNFDIPELIEEAFQTRVPESEMNEWISKKLNLSN